MFRNFCVLGAMFMLSACQPSGSGNVMYGQMENIREFGVVVSVTEGVGFQVTNLSGATVTSAATSAGNAAGSMVSGTLFSPMSGVFNSFGNLFKGSGTASADSVNHLEYVIDKDDGKRVTIDQVPAEGESVLYPGMRAMIQNNGEYLRVYPGDVEHRRERRS